MLAAAHNNLFVGSGTLSSTGTLSADNLSTTMPMFVDAAAYDYHLLMGSPAIGKAVAAGAAGAFSLTPTFEYVQPLGSVARAADADLGAFEYGTVVTPGDDGGAGSPDGGSEGGSSSGSGGGSSSGGSGGGGDGGSGGDGGASAPSSSGSHSGCGCLTAGREGGADFTFLGVAAALALLGRRSSRAR
jgi:hypothetical protein